MPIDGYNSSGLRREPMKAQVYRIIRDEILSGRFQFGSQLSEKNISNELDISRTPVREAFLLLQAEGLVEIYPQSGTYVFKPTKDDVINVCEMRVILESTAIKNAIKNKNSELISKLKGIVDESHSLLEDDLEGCHKLDTLFHTAIIEADPNPFLKQSYTIVANRMHALRQLLPKTRKRLSNATNDHSEIINAMESGNEKTTNKLIKQHVGNVEKMLLKALIDLESLS